MSVTGRFAALALMAALPVLFLSGCSKEPSGTYEARVTHSMPNFFADPPFTMTIDFKGGHKFHITMNAPHDAFSDDGEYKVEDDQISLILYNHANLELTIKGSTLTGDYGGDVTFVKK